MLVFVSNFFNHHQLRLCSEIYRLTNGDFIFVATEPIPKERLDMGYKDMNNSYDFVLRAYEDEAQYQKSLNLCKNADIVIVGSASDEYIKARDNKKITFKYSERPYKNTGLIKSFLSEVKHHYRFFNKNIYLLCASAYTAYDHAKFGMYKNKTYKWGYFPEVFSYDIDDVLKNKSEDNGISMLWAGRIIDWKHTEVAIRLAVKLNRSGYKCHLKIVGTGDCLPQMKSLVKSEKAEDFIEFTGPMSPENVREEMKKATVFLITSDKNEGWGAVLNEAMNSGCCAFAGIQVGSAPFLIKDGVNGFTYKSEDELYEKAVSVINDKDKMKKTAKNAYKTISEAWTAEIAAARLLCLAEALKNGKETPFGSGPCSKAEIIKG